MLNWIVWNRTICIKMDLALNNLQRLICHKLWPINQPTILFHSIFMFSGKVLVSIYLFIFFHFLSVVSQNGKIHQTTSLLFCDYYYYYYYYYYLLRVFRTSVCWWLLTGVWVTGSLLKSPRLFTVFWPILIML